MYSSIQMTLTICLIQLEGGHSFMTLQDCVGGRSKWCIYVVCVVVLPVGPLQYEHETSVWSRTAVGGEESQARFLHDRIPASFSNEKT